MGVIIYPCKIKERIGDLCEGKERKELIDKYERKGEEVLYILNKDLSEPFGVGFYTYESDNACVSMTYSTNWNLRCCLEDIFDEVERRVCFTTFLDANDIDNSVSYTIAEKMLKEFEANKDVVNKYVHKRFGDEYGDCLWRYYLRYIAVLKECVDIKGVVRYH